MTVTPHDPPSTWHVQSQSEPETQHLVDLFSNNGYGQCSCAQHTYRIQPELDAGKHPSILQRCKHLTAARNHFLDMVIQQLIATRPQ